MTNFIKKNIIFILPIILIIYFSLNLLGGNRGLFAYLDKKDQFENLLKKKLFLTNEITKVKKIKKTEVEAQIIQRKSNKKINLRTTFNRYLRRENISFASDIVSCMFNL